MPSPFEFCRPAAKKVVPPGPDWIHEVKYDGYCGRVVREGKDVKVLSKAGLDWTWRYPMIAEAALKMKQHRFVIDREICVLDVRGISQFGGCTPASTTTRLNSTPSTSWLWMATTWGRCRCSSARRSWPRC